MLPLYFYYRHLIETQGVPEVPGLVCEKGVWWFPAGTDGPPGDAWLEDEEALVLIWKHWRETSPDAIPAALGSERAFAAAWRAFQG